MSRSLLEADRPATSGVLRVMVADADAALRGLVCHDLELDRGLEVVGEVGDAGNLVAALERDEPDVVLLDLDLPGLDATAEQLLARRTVLAWAAEPDLSCMRSVTSIGARGFVRRGARSFEHLAELVKELAAGAIVIGAQVGPRLVAQFVAERSAAVAAVAELELARETLTARLAELTETYEATVEALARAVELRDEMTGGHIQRVSDYALAIAGTLDATLTEAPLRFGYLLHDIGKLRVPDYILLKAAPLTEEETALMQRHTIEGARFVEGIPFLREAAVVVRSHHERWDGTGYPDRLAGSEIPLIARLFSVADSLDAMTSDRPYRRALPLDAALAELRDNAGRQFDPEIIVVVDSLVPTHAAFAALSHGRGARASRGSGGG